MDGPDEKYLVALKILKGCPPFEMHFLVRAVLCRENWNL